ncbi:MAG: ABC transporter ATP-binding protein, partial [Clostridia bacterium]|nr:ABC transporter ATP-binding protein [Clostridia bacterium]
LVGLDPHAIKVLKSMFKELKEEGRTILISTHMIDSVEDYWDVAHIMMNGSFAATKVNENGSNSSKESLEELFFEITEKRVRKNENKRNCISSD